MGLDSNGLAVPYWAAMGAYGAYKSWGSSKTEVGGTNIYQQAASTIGKCYRMMKKKDMARKAIIMGHVSSKLAFTRHIQDFRTEYQKGIAPMTVWNYTTAPSDISGASGAQAVAEIVLYPATQIDRIMQNGYTATGLTAPNQYTGNRGLMPAFNIQNDAVTGDAQIVANDSNNPNSTNSTQLMHIPLWQYKFDIKNVLLGPVELDVFEYLCIENTNKNVVNFWQDSYNLPNDTANTTFRSNWNVGGAYGNTVAPSINRIGEHPHNKQLHKYWRKIAYAHVDLEPGGTLEYIVHNIRKTYCNEDNAADPTSFIAGWSKSFLVIARGPWVTDAATPTVLSTGSVDMNYITEEAGCQYFTSFASTEPQRMIFTANAANIPYLIVAAANEREINPQTNAAVNPTTGPA